MAVAEISGEKEREYTLVLRCIPVSVSLLREREREREEPASSWRPYRSPRTAEICTKRFAVSKSYPGTLIRVGFVGVANCATLNLARIATRDSWPRVGQASARARPQINSHVSPPPPALPIFPQKSCRPFPRGFVLGIRCDPSSDLQCHIIWKFDAHCYVYRY